MKKGWTKTRLKEISDIRYGFTESASVDEVGPKFLRITDIQNGSVNWGSVPYCKVDNSELKKYLLQKDDIVFARTGATTGKSYLIEGEPPKSVFASYLIRVQINNRTLYPRFLYQFFQTKEYWDEILLGTSGSAQGGVNATKLGNFQIPVPPLPEQKRIVKILDKAFTAIDKAKANAEKNLANAKELFESYLNGIFANPGDDWEEKRLGDLGKVQTGNTPPTKDKSNYGTYIPFAKPPHFKPNGNIETGESMLSESGLKKGRLFDANSILMVCIGATIGKTGFSEIPISSNQQINTLTPFENYYARFFYYAFISETVQKQVLEQGKSAQATLPIINKTKWENILVPFSKSIETQKQIVKKLDKLQAETKHLEKTYQQKIADVEELKKSILQKAFEGEL